MLNILSSKATKPNDDFAQMPRQAGEDNLEWLSRAINGRARKEDPAQLMLLGGVDTCSFRLRVAQSHLRNDLSPSFWSHVALLGATAKRIERSPVHEVSLMPANGFGFPASANAVQTSSLAGYRDAKAYPNIAVIHLPVSLEQMLEPLEAFKAQRAVLDAVELLVLWLAYAWGVGRTGNPLLEGRGIPSAAMLEAVAAAAGIDLTPGLESRSSCPEAIWQAARWWHRYYEETTPGQKSLSGKWHAEHFLTGSTDPKAE